MDTLILSAALASGLLGGAFLAFSSFVMPALGRIPPAEAIRAMQRINVDVFHWAFMGLFLGAPLLCALLATWQLVAPYAAQGTFLLIGCALQVGLSFALTAAGNVPLNDKLARIVASNETEVAKAQWRAYTVPWTRWNTARTIGNLAAATMLTLAYAG